MLVGRLGILILMIVLAMSCLAEISVNPQRHEISKVEPEIPYKIIVTVINQNLFRQDFFVALAADSGYIADYTGCEPKTFTLEPNEKINLIITLAVPLGFPPGAHVLQYDIMSNAGKQGQFVMHFSVPGEEHRNLSIGSHSVSVEDEGTAYFTLNLTNTGNSIATGYPEIEVYRDGRLVQTFGNETRVNVMPLEDYSFSIMRDLSGLLPSEYTFRAKIVYGAMESNTIEGKFTMAAKPDTGKSYDVAQGQDIRVPFDLKNPGGKLSFYKISYSFEGINLTGIDEGEMHTPEKHVEVKLATAQLEPGTYEVTMETAWGEKLENSAVRSVNINVIGENKMSPLVWIIPCALSGLGILIGVFILLRRRSHVATEITSLKSSFERIEEDTKKLTHDIYLFVEDSNRWLEANGYTSQFK
jgi:hypothetical protein